MQGLKFQIMLSVALVLNACSNAEHESTELKSIVPAEGSDPELTAPEENRKAVYQAILETYVSTKTAVEKDSTVSSVPSSGHDCAKGAESISDPDWAQIVKYIAENCRNRSSKALQK